MLLRDVILVSSGLLLYIWLTVMLLRHRVYRRFPFFVVYSIYAIVASAGSLVALYVPGTYFYVFWISEIGSLLLAVIAIHEVFQSVFEGFYLLPWFRWGYFASLAIVLAFSIVNVVFNRPVQAHPLYSLALDITTPANCVLVAICALLYMAAKLLKVSLSRQSSAIVLGLGLCAVGNLIPDVMRSVFGKKLESFDIYGSSVSYYLALIIWLTAFYRQESGVGEPPPLSSEEMADEVKQYTRILKGLLGKSKGDDATPPKDDDAAPPDVSSRQMADEVR